MKARIHIDEKKIMNRSRAIAWKTFRGLLLAGFCFAILYPLLIMLSKTFMSLDDIMDNSVLFFPKNASTVFLDTALKQLDYWNSLRNSVLLSLFSMLAQTFICCFVGYGFARFAFPLRKLMFIIVIVTIVVPPQLIMVPLYLLFQYFDPLGLVTLFTGDSINLLNRFTPFVLLSLTGQGLRNGLFIFLFRQFFTNMPKEIEEAAIVDGAGIFQTFFRVFVPNVVTPIVTVGLFSFVWQYNDTVYSGLFLKTLKVLPMMYRNLYGIGQIEFGGLTITNIDVRLPFIVAGLKASGVLLMLAPVIALYTAGNRFFVQSIERTGIVG
jgi:multiple sugar transport system permease protein